jgi:23S rRNA pseudouridine1911/1915/1917 synthase
MRLDKYLAQSDRVGSRRNASIALERGRVFVNGRAAQLADAKRQLHAGDRVLMWTDRPGSARKPSRAKAEGDLWILYEDDALLVVNKPPGLLSVPLERKADADSAYDTVERHLRPHGKRRPLIVHRIDRDTSGLVVFAKDARTQHLLKDQFRRHEAERVYLAVVYGAPDPASGTWRDRLVWDQRSLIQKETHPDDPKGADAISRYRTVERFADASLIEVHLETGKRNQIRLQARLRGHTLIGEKRYVYGPDVLRPIAFPRQALHAWRLTVHHPGDGRVLRFEAPLPADLEDLLRSLRGGKQRG